MSTTSVPSKTSEDRGGALNTILGLGIVVVLVLVTHYLYNLVKPLTLPGGIPGKVLEYPIWGAAVGLVFNGILKATNTFDRVKSGFKTELFLKIGLILLGASVSFAVLVTAAGGAVIQGLIMVTSVYFFSWWLSGKFGIPDTLRAVMSLSLIHI